MAFDRPLNAAELERRTRARRPARAARAAAVRARGVGVPPADAHGRPAGVDPAARDGDPGRAGARADRRARGAARCSTSAPGSGAIALAIADEHAGALVTGDRQLGRRARARRRERVPHRPRGASSPAHDLFDGLPAGPWDLVVSNPPYVDAADLATLQPEVRDWEPHAALSADGAVEAVARGSVQRARARRRTRARGGGGPGRARPPSSSRSSGSTTSAVTPDLNGIDRVVEGRRRDATSTTSSGRSATGSWRCCRPTRCTASSAPPRTGSPLPTCTGSRGGQRSSRRRWSSARVDVLPDHLPELDGRVLAIVAALLPGPYTLVVPNPAHRFAWLTEGRPGSIGLRVPVLAGVAAVDRRAPRGRRRDEREPARRARIHGRSPRCRRDPGRRRRCGRRRRAAGRRRPP